MAVDSADRHASDHRNFAARVRQWLGSPQDGWPAKLFAILSSSVVAFAAILLLRGNLSILACPVGLWLGIVLWPRSFDKKRIESVTAVRASRDAAHSTPSPVIRGWIMVAVAWIAASTTLAVKLVTAPVTERKVEASMAQVERLVRNGRWLEALNKLDEMEIPDRYPLRQAQRHHNRGVLLLRLGRRDEAAEALQESIRFDRANAEAYVILGKLVLESGQASEAVRWLERAHEIEPRRRDVVDLIAKARDAAAGVPATSSAP